MKFLIKTLIFFLCALCAGEVKALTRAQIPTKMGVAWGASAGAAYIRTIPVGSQIGIQNCAASFTDGFPPLTFIPASSGGCPPFGADFNGILNAITLWSQWTSAGGPMPYDAAFQTAIGGYPRDAMVQSNILHGRIWHSVADNNLTNPDDQTGAAVSWEAMPGTAPAGTPIPALLVTGAVLINTVIADSTTVGNASSNATRRANADAYWLFVAIWNNCTYCTLFNSSGGTISRGASAAADWNANDAIATPDMRGRGLIGGDFSGSTRLSGVPVTSGSTTTGLSIIGENLHALSVAELATHNHGVTDPTHAHGYSDPGHTHNVNGVGVVGSGTLNIAGGSTIPSQSTNFTTTNSGVGITISAAATGISINNTGSGTGHNTVQQSAVIFWYLAL